MPKSAVDVWVLIEHIEIDHERELTSWWVDPKLKTIHNDLHVIRDDWGHDHLSG